MNKKDGRLLLIALGGLAIGAATMLLPTGCSTTQTVAYSTNDVTGVVTGITNRNTVVDTNKLTQIEDALEPAVASVTRRVLKNSPQHADEIAGYLRSVGSIFCQMEANNNFDPIYLIAAADQIAAPQIEDDTVIDIKNTAIAIYKIAWGDRFHAELAPDMWVVQASRLVCHSIDAGLKDAGKPGIGPN